MEVLMNLTSGGVIALSKENCADCKTLEHWKEEYNKIQIWMVMNGLWERYKKEVRS